MIDLFQDNTFKFDLHNRVQKYSKILDKVEKALNQKPQNYMKFVQLMNSSFEMYQLCYSEFFIDMEAMGLKDYMKIFKKIFSGYQLQLQNMVTYLFEKISTQTKLQESMDAKDFNWNKIQTLNENLLIDLTEEEKKQKIKEHQENMLNLQYSGGTQVLEQILNNINEIQINQNKVGSVDEIVNNDDDIDSEDDIDGIMANMKNKQSMSRLKINKLRGQFKQDEYNDKPKTAREAHQRSKKRYKTLNFKKQDDSPDSALKYTKFYQIDDDNFEYSKYKGALFSKKIFEKECQCNLVVQDRRSSTSKQDADLVDTDDENQQQLKNKINHIRSQPTNNTNGENPYQNKILSSVLMSGSRRLTQSQGPSKEDIDQIVNNNNININKKPTEELRRNSQKFNDLEIQKVVRISTKEVIEDNKEVQKVDQIQINIKKKKNLKRGKTIMDVTTEVAQNAMHQMEIEIQKIRCEDQVRQIEELENLIREKDKQMKIDEELAGQLHRKMNKIEDQLKDKEKSYYELQKELVFLKAAGEEKEMAIDKYLQENKKLVNKLSEQERKVQATDKLKGEIDKLYLAEKEYQKKIAQQKEQILILEEEKFQLTKKLQNFNVSLETKELDGQNVKVLDVPDRLPEMTTQQDEASKAQTYNLQESTKKLNYLLNNLQKTLGTTKSDSNQFKLLLEEKAKKEQQQERAKQKALKEQQEKELKFTEKERKIEKRLSELSLQKQFNFKKKTTIKQSVNFDVTQTENASQDQVAPGAGGSGKDSLNQNQTQFIEINKRKIFRRQMSMGSTKFTERKITWNENQKDDHIETRSYRHNKSFASGYEKRPQSVHFQGKGDNNNDYQSSDFSEYYEDQNAYLIKYLKFYNVDEFISKLKPEIDQLIELVLEYKLKSIQIIKQLTEQEKIEEPDNKEKEKNEQLQQQEEKSQTSFKLNLQQKSTLLNSLDLTQLKRQSFLQEDKMRKRIKQLSNIPESGQSSPDKLESSSINIQIITNNQQQNSTQINNDIGQFSSSIQKNNQEKTTKQQQYTQQNVQINQNNDNIILNINHYQITSDNNNETQQNIVLQKKNSINSQQSRLTNNSNQAINNNSSNNSSINNDQQPIKQTPIQMQNYRKSSFRYRNSQERDSQLQSQQSNQQQINDLIRISNVNPTERRVSLRQSKNSIEETPANSSGNLKFHQKLNQLQQFDSQQQLADSQNLAPLKNSQGLQHKLFDINVIKSQLVTAGDIKVSQSLTPQAKNLLLNEQNESLLLSNSSIQNINNKILKKQGIQNLHQNKFKPLFSNKQQTNQQDYYLREAIISKANANAKYAIHNVNLTGKKISANSRVQESNSLDNSLQTIEPKQNDTPNQTFIYKMKQHQQVNNNNNTTNNNNNNKNINSNNKNNPQIGNRVLKQIEGLEDARSEELENNISNNKIDQLQNPMLNNSLQYARNIQQQQQQSKQSLSQEPRQSNNIKQSQFSQMQQNKTARNSAQSDFQEIYEIFKTQFTKLAKLDQNSMLLRQKHDKNYQVLLNYVKQILPLRPNEVLINKSSRLQIGGVNFPTLTEFGDFQSKISQLGMQNFKKFLISTMQKPPEQQGNEELGYMHINQSLLEGNVGANSGMQVSKSTTHLPSIQKKLF